MATDQDEFIPTRETLLIRLRDLSDDESWKQFFEIYWKLIYNAAIRAGLSDAEAQDVVQETILALVKNLPEFKYDRQAGSFKGYLLTLTQWRIKDQFRRRFRVDVLAGDAYHGMMALVPDPKGFLPETYWDEEWEKNLMEVARERIKKKVNPKHYQIFDLNVDQRWPAHKVADALKVSPALVYLVRHRISRALAKEIKELRAEEHNEDHRQ